MLSAAAVIEGATATTKVVRIKPPRVSPVNRTEVEEAIERAYEIVVVSDLSDPERAAAIESGANLLPTMREVQSRFPIRGQLDIAIEYVRFSSASTKPKSGSRSSCQARGQFPACRSRRRAMPSNKTAPGKSHARRTRS
jgi:hypothetical protein